MAPLAIPQSVKEVIGRRLRHLSDECNRLLGLASVLGREFDLDALAGVSELERDAILELLDEAIEARVVSEVPSLIGRLRFAHALIREAAYHGLTRSRRVRLHRQVGEALEALYSSDLDPHLAELAHHFLEAAAAGKRPEGSRLRAARGRSSLSQLAYEEAARLFEMALTLVGAQDAARCELLLALGDAQARAGDTPALRESFRAAADLAEDLGLHELLARAALGYGGRVIWEVSRGDVDHVPLLERALTALGEEDSTLRVRLLARLAGGPLRDATFPPERRRSLSEEALEMARRVGDPETLAYALSALLSRPTTRPSSPTGRWRWPRSSYRWRWRPVIWNGLPRVTSIGPRP